MIVPFLANSSNHEQASFIECLLLQEHVLGSGDQSKRTTGPCHHDVRVTNPGDGVRAGRRVLRGARERAASALPLRAEVERSPVRVSLDNRSERGRQVWAVRLQVPPQIPVSAQETVFSCEDESQPLVREEVPVAGPRPRGRWLLRAVTRPLCAWPQSAYIHLVLRNAPLINTRRERVRAPWWVSFPGSRLSVSMI